MTVFKPEVFAHMYALCEQYYSLSSKMKGTLNFFATTIHVYSLIVLFLLIICVFAAFLDAVISVGGEAAFVSFSINLEKVMIEKVVFIYWFLIFI